MEMTTGWHCYGGICWVFLHLYINKVVVKSIPLRLNAECIASSVPQNGKPTFLNSSLGFCPICMKSLKLCKLLTNKFLQLTIKMQTVASAINTKCLILGWHEIVRVWAQFGECRPPGGAKNRGSLYLMNGWSDFHEIQSVWCRVNPEAIYWRWPWLVNVGVAYFKINNKH